MDPKKKPFLDSDDGLNEEIEFNTDDECLLEESEDEDYIE